MYSVDAIDLRGSEYEELKLLVEALRGGEDLHAVAFRRLNPSGDRYLFDERLSEVYSSLNAIDLINGVSLIGGGFSFGDVTQKGIDFIDDFAALQASEERRTGEQRRHDYKVAAFGAVCGAVSGGVLGFLGGAFSDQIARAVSRALGI